MIEAKFTRCKDPADPNRCQAVHGNMGQCPFMAYKNEHGVYQKYCIRHGATKSSKHERKASLDLYRAAQWQTRIKDQASHANIKTLNNEVGILRIMLEEHLNICKDNSDLLLRSSTLSELVEKISRTVQSCHKLDKELGQMLDKGQALKMAQEFVTIITQYVEDPFLLEVIGEEIMETVDKILKEGPADLK